MSVNTKPPGLVFLFVLSCILLSGCGDIYRYLSSDEVGWAIKREVRDRQQSEITLARLTRFSWDELIIFGSYTPRNEICRRLQLNETDCITADLPEPLNDGLNLLVFRLNGRIVHREMQLGYHGEFRVDERSFTPRDAVFVVKQDSLLSNGQRQLILLSKLPSQPINPARHSP